VSKFNTTGYKTGHIPVEPLATLVDNYLKAQDGARGSDAAGPMGMLCVRSKVNPRRLNDLVHRKTKWIDFNNADKLLCAINKTDYFLFHPELSEQYSKVSLKGRSKTGDWIPQIENTTCVGCGKAFSYYSNFSGRGRKYCSQTCGNKNASYVRWEEEDAA